ncbi:DUF411 domain-containing protein [Nitrincola tapanii]|uniref:DUF411 domain-containing protein n=1 Tax=Nitrincola tapanii TaxID=1708751 RepID=A0A5A9W8K5_9GAMM|nr:DUF411 domain-containing protein [Nitrincola tapanii]KAA0876448.1 DUF411 domain-containing protein [Nitrincola tapanii]
MLKSVLLGCVASLLISADVLAESMKVYKSETCGCCNDWIDHVREAGFEVEAINHANMNQKKQALGLPAQLASCHTAIIEGYLIEGHVPASDILRLLQERPKITGLSVPGMPHGSPGMETGRVDAYQVLAFDVEKKSLEVWAEY